MTDLRVLGELVDWHKLALFPDESIDECAPGVRMFGVTND